jgi:phosphoenolpyruvate carboxylase
VPDAGTRERIFASIEAKHERTVRHALAITGNGTLLEDNPTLVHSIHNRFPNLDDKHLARAGIADR